MTRTLRSPAWLAYLRTLPCSWCARPAPSEASHHGPHGVSIKADDMRAIPLCTGCHREYHQAGRLGYMTGKDITEWALAIAWRLVADRLHALTEAA